MPQLAKCPQCQHDLLAPEDVVSGAWVRCPSCWSFFQMKDATTRNLPSLEVIEASTPPSAPKPVAEKSDAAQTVEDLASTATWSDDAEDHDEPLTLADVKPAEPTRAQEVPSFEAETVEMASLLESQGTPNEDAPSLESNLLDEPATIPLKPTLQPEDTHAAPLKFAGSEDLETEEFAESDDASLETPEEAAQRIDAWFRSAKTIEDVPPVDDMPPVDMTAIDEPSVLELKHTPESVANNATIDLSSAGIDELDLSNDFELEHPSEASAEPVAPWDDSHHIDQLLANIQDEPAQYEEELQVAEVAGTDADELDHYAGDESAEPDTDWMPEESLAINPGGGSQQRSKSLVRTLVLPAVCGLFGLALGYYVLLWLRGPQIDFLDAAKYLPKAMLPASFGPKPHQAVLAALPPTDAAAQPPANEPADASNDAAKTADTAKPTDAPAEKLASFTEPADASKIKTADDDRYATTAPAADKVAEPATFSPQPPAVPVSDTPPAAAAEPVRVSGAPSFSATDLAAALVAAKDAEAGLINGSLTDGHDVARTKGFSYSILADLAQKATFNDPTAADEEKLQQDTDNLFRTTLATPHARDEVAQIVPKWIASPNRKQGGVFFAGTLAGANNKQGSVVECDLDLGAGYVLPVLLPPELAEKPPAGPVAVVGYIVDKPAQRINGYTGTTPEAVFATKLIPLQ